MKKPTNEIIFRQINGIWQSINEIKPRILADVLESLNIIVTDTCEFARFKFPNKKEPGTTIYYRVYGGKITLTTWEY